MDPQIVNDLNDHIKQLNDVMANQAGLLNNLVTSIKNTNSSIRASNTNTTEFNNNIVGNTSLTGASSKTVDAYSAAVQEANRLLAADAANFSKAANDTKAALIKTKDAILSGEPGFAKYGSAFSSLGSAAQNLGKNFGFLGKILGFTVKVGSEVLGHMAKQADDIAKATDSVSKLGAINGFSMEQIRQMGAKAGLASYELDKLIKPMQSVQGGFVGLGINQTEGIKRFSELTDASVRLRNQYRHLGMDDEARNQAFADFISAMNASGQSYKGELGTAKGLANAADQYISNLYALADMTGESVQDLGKERQALMSDQYTIIETRELAKREKAANELLKNGSPEEKARASAELDRIKKERAGLNNLMNVIQDRKLDQRTAHALLRAYATGVYDDSLKSITLVSGNIANDINRLKTGQMTAGELSNKLMERQSDAIEAVGMTTLTTNQEVANTFGAGEGNLGALGRVGQQLGTDREKVEKEAIDGVQRQKNTKDPAQLARDKEVETMRVARLSIDAYEAAHNPFLKGTKILDGFKDQGSFVVKALLTLAAAAVAVKTGSIIFKFFRRGGKGTSGELVKEAERGGEKGLKSLGGKLLRGGGRLLKGGAIVAGIAAAGYGISQLAGNFGMPSFTGPDGEKLPANTEEQDIVSQLQKEMSASAGEGEAVGESGDIGENLAAEGLSQDPEQNKVNPEDQANEKLQSLNKLIVLQTEKLNDLTKKLNETTGKIAEQTRARELALISKYKFDPAVIENNSQAVAIYEQQIGEATKLEEPNVADLASTLKSFEGISQKLYADLEYFSRLPIDAIQAKNNAEAFTEFAKAMASFNGYGNSEDKAETIGKTSDGFLKQAGNLTTFLYFSMLPINPKKTKDNATAFVNFSNAMTTYKGGPKLLDVISTMLGSKLMNLFKQDGPIEAFGKFAEDMQKLNLDDKKILSTTTAFLNFSKAMGILSGGPSTGSVFKTALNAGAGAAGTLLGAAGSIAGAIVGAAATAGQFIASAVGGIGDWAKDTIFRTGVNNMARKWNVDANDLLGMMASESGLNPAAVNPKGGATGLIQFMPSTAAALGTSTSALRGMSRAEQLPYVEKFFSQMKLPQNATAGQMYATVFLPKYNKKPNNFVVARQGGPNDAGDNKSGSWYSSNKGLDVLDPKGAITISDLGARVDQKRKAIGLGPSSTVPQAREGGLFSGPGTGYPMEMHGTEMIIPRISTDSLLMQLSKSNSDIADLGRIIQETAHLVEEHIKSNLGNTVETGSATHNFLKPEMITSLSTKFDKVISVLGESDYVQGKILQHTSV